MKEAYNNKTFSRILKILLFAFFISIVGIGFQMKANNDNKYYFSYKTSIPELNIEKEESGAFRTSIDYDTTYTNQDIKNSNNAKALIKKDSNIQKQKCSNEKISSIENELEKNYDIVAVNLCEVDLEVANNIKNVLDRIYSEFPQVKGYITNLSLLNNEDTTGYIVAFMPSFSFASSNTLTTYPIVKKTQVLFNASYFLNLSKLKTSIRNAASSGWFSTNTTVESLIAHEFGHYLSFLVNMNTFDIDSILFIEQSKAPSYNKMLSSYNNGKVSQKIISEAHEAYKKDTSSNISLIDFRRSISEYAIATDEKGNYIYDETIAEAMNDYYQNGDNACDASKYIIQILKKKIGEFSMKKAIGELNLTVIVLLLLGAILAFFLLFKGTMFSNIKTSSCCISSGGSYENGTCNVRDQAAYSSCVGGSSSSNSSSSSTTIGNGDLLNSSSSLKPSHITTNTQDQKVENSINKELSVSNTIDTSKDDKNNKELDKNSKDSIKDILNNSSGSNNNSSNKEDEKGGTISGKDEAEIKKKANSGLNTNGDYTKSKIVSTTSNYNADKSTYTTTSTIKSNTSNHTLQLNYTYSKGKDGDYTLTKISWKETKSSNNVGDGYEKYVEVEDKKIKNSYNETLKNQYSDERARKYIEENALDIYNELHSQVVFLDTYSNESIIKSANGVFINSGIIVTTWNYIKQSIVNGNKIVITNSNGGIYQMDGILSINIELDLAFIKLKEKVGKKTELGNVYDLKVETIDFTICTGEDYLFEVKYGYLLKRGGLITSVIRIDESEEGSPLFDHNKLLIGINTSQVLQSSTSIARSTNYIKNLQAKLEKQDFNAIQVTSFNDLKEKYINDAKEIEDKAIPDNIWKKYKKIGDIENTIDLDLIKSSYDRNIISLRYMNDIKEYSDNLSLATDFINKLTSQGYKKRHESKHKMIYQKGNSKVILLSEFNYLIVIMMGE